MKRKFTLALTTLLLLIFIYPPLRAVGQSRATKTEGFQTKTAGTNYQSTVTINEDESDCGIGWSIYYGTVSTNSPITVKSAQMRYYKSASSNYGYLKSTTAVPNLSHIAFKAKVQSTSIKMDVDWSTDGTTWNNLVSDYTFASNATVENIGYDIPSGGQYIKISVSQSSTAPSSGYYSFVVDDVVFTSTSTTPEITIDDALTVTPIAVTNGELAVFYQNIAPESGTITLFDAQDNDITSTCDWFSADFNADFSKVIYSAPENATSTAHSLRMHLHVAEGSTVADADVAVSQDFILETMDQIFARATENGATAKPVTINFNGWVISGVNNSSYQYATKDWLTDGTKGCVISSSSPSYAKFKTNDKLNGKVTCNLGLKTGYAEITSLISGNDGTTATEGLTVTNDGTITPVTNITITDLTAINTGSVVTFTGFTCQSSEYNSSSGYTLSDGTYTISIKRNTIPFNFELINGKTYNITGVFDVVSSNKYIYPRGTDDIEEVIPSDPTIYVNPTAFSDFSYIIGVGPSTAQTVKIEGINLTHDITVAFSGTDASAFEMSLSQNTGYTNTITLTHSSGTVSETTVYVRLKENFAAQNYSAALELSSEDATPQNIALSGSVINLSFIWNLTTNSYSSTSTTLVQWTSDYAIMKNEKNTSGTNANNYIPTSNNSTRFYSNQKLSLIPAENYVIVNAVFTATTSSYATAFANSSWTNATATASTGSSPYTVTVTPTNGSNTISAIIGATCGFYSVTVYYKELDSYAISIDNTIENGSVSVVGNLTEAHENATISMTATPDDGYVFQSWNVYKTGDSQTTINVENNQFTMPAYPVTISASFRAKATYTVSYSVNGSVQSTESVTEGDEATLPASPSGIPSGCTFVGWSISAASTTTTNSYIPEGNATLYAVFSIGLPITYNFTISANDFNTTSYNANNNEKTSNATAASGENMSVKWTSYQVMKGTSTHSNECQWQSGKGYIYNSTDLGTIKSVTLNGVSGATFTTYYGEATQPSSSTTVGNGYFQVKVGNATGYTTSIDVVFEKNTLMYYTLVKNITSAETMENILSSYLITVKNNGVLTLTGTNSGNENNLIIEDGGQLITSSSNVAATVKKSIAAWSIDPVGGWYFIASPISTAVRPEDAGLLTDALGGKPTYDLYYLDNTTWKNYRQTPFNLNNGQGYLYADSTQQTLAFTGAIKPYNTTNNTVTLTKTGWNLIGNPFTCAVTVDKDFNEVNNGSTVTNKTAGSTINPCAGIAVNGSEGEVVTFTKPTSNAPIPNNLSLVLAQQIVNRGESSSQTLDNAIVSFNEDSKLAKFYFGTQNANLYIPQGAEEYAIVNTEVQGEMPVSFRANENGQYTLTVNPEGVEMNYLHLIDNMTGTDVDLLATPSYTFNAKKNDFENRFKLVFAANNGATDSAADPTFAFFSNGNLIINNAGEATLQVIDITGRVLSSETINGGVSIGTSGLTAGVYVLRLVNGKDVKTQKIVVE